MLNMLFRSRSSTTYRAGNNRVTTTSIPQTTTTMSDADDKVTSALTLSSLAFVIVVLFVMLWPFRKKIAEMTKPFLRCCFERTRKQVQSTRKTISKQFEKSARNSTKEQTQNTNQAPIYATITKNKRTKTEAEDSETSSNDAYSLPDEEIQESGMVTVELHAYQTIAAVESDCQPTQLMKIVSPSPIPSRQDSFSSDYDTIEANEKFLDLATGCPIYDKVDSGTLNNRK